MAALVPPAIAVPAVMADAEAEIHPADNGGAAIA
jgi:hypothetical protein